MCVWPVEQTWALNAVEKKQKDKIVKADRSRGELEQKAFVILYKRIGYFIKESASFT